jgi:ABC-type multidrug transport system fused ATPase/permease subunit
MNDFNDPDKDRVLDKAIEMSYIFLIIAAAAWLSAAVGLACWMYVAERITKRVREDYVRAVLRQEMAWFDKNKAVEMSARLSADSIVLLGAIGEKIMSLCMNSVVFIGGVIIGLVRGWQLALLVLGVTPIIGVCVGVLMGFLSKSSERVQSAYAKAGGVAEEAFASIRTVSAFSGEDTEYERYARELKPAFDAGVKKGLYEGIAFGGMNLTFFGAYALCLWFGAFLIRDKITNAWSGNAWTGGEVMTVFFAVLMGAFSLGQIGPSMQAIAAGRAAAYRLYEVIDRVPPIDVLSEGGAKFDNLRANVEFRDVHFRYPTRDEVSILRGLSFSVRAGQTVALVGTSGCGKSTALALLERFYDVDRGAILVDGHDLRELNVAWWRQQVAMVSQEPVLFDATIEDNIRFGKPDATREEIEAAAKLANAHAFINTLPDKYKTMCGEGGSQLSGGQKQRIAIARAIVRNPKLLLLDEATSALDSKSEREVQEALERVMEGRTTIVVAHRLSTIVNADCIFVIDRGVLVEQGTHAELTARNGVYANLVRAQEAANRSLDDDMDGVDVEEKKAESELRRDPSLKKATSEARPRSGSHAERSKKLSGTATGAGEGTKGEEEEDETAKLPDPGAAGVLKLISQQSLGFLLLGFLGGGLSGVVLPLWGLVFSEIVNVFYITDAAEQREQAMWWSLAFLGLGLLSVAAEMLKSGSMGVVGERLTLDLRQKVFRNLLRQDMTFFDRPENSSGLLALRLSSDATMVQAGVSYRSALLLQLNATFITGLIVSFVASWKMSLVVLAVLPL